MSSTTQTAINNARDSIQELDYRKGSLQNQLGEVVLVRNFLQAWQNQCQQGLDKDAALEKAKDSLPKDNPKTNFNEEVTFDELKEDIERYFKDNFESIYKKWNIDNGADNNPIYKEYVARARTEIVKLVWGMQMIGWEIEDQENEIKELEELQKTDTYGGM